MNFVELICEDYTMLGGQMGTERTSEIFRQAFKSVKRAKEFAEQDHKRRDDRAEIHWKGNSSRLHSGDLLSHAYTIVKRKVA